MTKNVDAIRQLGFALKETNSTAFTLAGARAVTWFYAGKLDRGCDKASTAELKARLKPLIRKTQPFAKKVAHRAIWVEPSGIRFLKGYEKIWKIRAYRRTRRSAAGS